MNKEIQNILRAMDREEIQNILEKIQNDLEFVEGHLRNNYNEYGGDDEMEIANSISDIEDRIYCLKNKLK